MKKLLSYVCILAAIACQPAQAREYYRNYEPVGHNSSSYARVPQEKQYHYERPQHESRRHESPRFTRLTDEQVNNTNFNRKFINLGTFSLSPYIGVDVAKGENKYNESLEKYLFGKSMKRFGVFSGLQFNQYIGFEAFYNKGGMNKKSYTIEDTFSELKLKNTMDFTSFGVDLMGDIPIFYSMDIILGLGYGWYTFNTKIDADFYNFLLKLEKEGDVKDKFKDEAIRFSLGAQYLINDKWAFRLLGRYADFLKGDVIKNMMEVSLGLRYTF